MIIKDFIDVKKIFLEYWIMNTIKIKKLVETLNHKYIIWIKTRLIIVKSIKVILKE